MTIPQRVPGNILSSLFWDIVSVRTVINTSLAGVTEQNFAFNLSTSGQAAQYAALFDQWCIPQVSVSMWSQQAPGGSNAPAEYHTAIDFDNITAISTLAAIDQYDNVQYGNLVDNKRHTRSLRPRMKLTTPASTGGALAANWCDCAAPATAWNGFRSIFAAGVTAVNTIVIEISVWYAFRGRI